MGMKRFVSFFSVNFCQNSQARPINTLLVLFSIALFFVPGYAAAAYVCNSGTGVPCEQPLELNFMPSVQITGRSGSMPSTIRTDMYQWQIVSGCCKPGNKQFTNQTPFLTQDSWYSNGQDHWQLPQVVSWKGVDYYHIIVGSEADGFIQETWIPLGYSMDFSGTAGRPANSPVTWGFAVNQYKSGGCGTVCDTWHSASAGDSRIVAGGGNGPIKVAGNAEYPLTAPTGKNSGNGSGNPSRVLIRQKLITPELTVEFLKDKFDKKPVITQDLKTADIRSYVKIDMSNSDYNTASTAGAMTNTLTSPSGNVPVSFDVHVNSQAGHSHVNAGQYTYTPGTPGPLSEGFDWGGANGTYTYAEGGFDVNAVDWSRYFDSSWSNPWAFTKYRPE
jgi:hypothetical protein